jgi:hypothetical protein
MKGQGEGFMEHRDMKGQGESCMDHCDMKGQGESCMEHCDMKWTGRKLCGVLWHERDRAKALWSTVT